jgi:hypothetical protein
MGEPGIREFSDRCGVLDLKRKHLEPQPVLHGVAARDLLAGFGLRAGRLAGVAAVFAGTSGGGARHGVAPE